MSLCGALFVLLVAGPARAQGPASPLEIKSIAEVESRPTHANPATPGPAAVTPGPAAVTPGAGAVTPGAGAVKLVPADRVVPGDRVIYTLEVRNAGATALDAPIFSYPIPEHMRYIADSAVGPGAEVSYSTDGGRTFERAENLKVVGAGGKSRAAAAADYTDIRWKLKNSLKANSVAFVRFRALVK